MAYTKDEAIDLAKKFLNEASKMHHIQTAYLFGSYARDVQKDYSDIDIAIVLSNISRGRRYYNETVEIFHEAQEYNSLLEVICFREDEFEKNGESIVTQIKKEGIVI